MSQIDWVKCIIPFTHKKHIHGGVRARFEDSIDYKLDYQILENLSVEGSASSCVQIRTMDAWEFFQPKKGEPVPDTIRRYSTFLPVDYVRGLIIGGGYPDKYKGHHFFIQIEGNLAKFFQGQSIHSSSDVVGLVKDFCLFISNHFEITPTAENLRMWDDGEFYIQRLDICESRRLSNYKVADRYINGFVKSASLNGRGFRFDHNEKKEGFTAVHSTSGQLYRFSVYNKYCDLRDNKYAKLHFDDDLNKKIMDYSDGLVRFEIKYKSNFFRRNNISSISDVLGFFGSVDNMLHNVFDKLVFGGSNMNTVFLNELKSKIPKRYLIVYMLWLDGETPNDIKTLLGNGKRTRSADRFYQRTSKFLRDNYNLNLKVRLSNSTRDDFGNNVVPFIQVLEAKPEPVPDFFYENDLIYTPKKNYFSDFGK